MAWTHAICDACWWKRNPDREPIRMKLGAGYQACCFCGTKTSAGIYVRHNPKELDCNCE